MKIFAVITVARQIDGEYCFVRTEQAFKQASKADELRNKLNGDYKLGDKFKPIRLSTPNGDVDCNCVAGAFELDLVE